MCEGLLSSPVLVESPLSLLADMLGPDGLQGSQAAGGLDVADNTNSDHWRGLDDGTAFDDLLLVRLGAGPVDLPDNVGHAGLVAHEAGQVDGLGGVILRECLWLSLMTLGTFLGEESLRSVAGGLKLSVRLKKEKRLEAGIDFKMRSQDE